MATVIIVGIVFALGLYAIDRATGKQVYFTLSPFAVVIGILVAIYVTPSFAMSHQTQVFELQESNGLTVFPHVRGYTVLYGNETHIVPESQSTLDFVYDSTPTITIRSVESSWWHIKNDTTHTIVVSPGSAVCVPHVFCPEDGYYSE